MFKKGEVVYLRKSCYRYIEPSNKETIGALSRLQKLRCTSERGVFTVLAIVGKMVTVRLKQDFKTGYKETTLKQGSLVRVYEGLLSRTIRTK